MRFVLLILEVTSLLDEYNNDKHGNRSNLIIPNIYINSMPSAYIVITLLLSTHQNLCAHSLHDIDVSTYGILKAK